MSYQEVFLIFELKYAIKICVSSIKFRILETHILGLLMQMVESGLVLATIGYIWILFLNREHRYIKIQTHFKSFFCKVMLKNLVFNSTLISYPTLQNKYRKSWSFILIELLIWVLLNIFFWHLCYIWNVRHFQSLFTPYRCLKYV